MADLPSSIKGVEMNEGLIKYIAKDHGVSVLSAKYLKEAHEYAVGKDEEYSDAIEYYFNHVYEKLIEE